VAFRFQKASCVVVGTFNIYILHPQWLAKHGIIEQGIDVGIETNLMRPGLRLRFPKQNTVWSIAPDRLVIETQEPDVDCAVLAGQVLQKLPETPLFALGHNFHYVAGLDELGNMCQAIRDFPQTEPPGPDQVVAQRTFHAAVKRADHETVNLQLSIKDDSIELACNVHYELGVREKPSEAGVAATARFFDDRAEAKVLAQHFFGASIDHAPNNF
jgi:hypothetical protein